MNLFKGLYIAALLAVPGMFSMVTASAQTYPQRPVHVIVPTPVGGGQDVIIRLMATQLSELWGQQIVVDNRTGAGVIVGTTVAAKAPADGYTLLMTATDHVLGPSLTKDLPYDPIKDFVPVAEVGVSPLVLVVNPKVNAHTVRELVDYARANPGKLAFGSAGIGSFVHLAGESFKKAANIDMLHVPYQGTAPAYIDLMAGSIQLMFPAAASALGRINSGELRALAVTTEKRISFLPDLPPVADTYPGFDAAIWYGVLAPSGTPPAIVSKINADMRKVLDSAELKKAVVALGIEIKTGSPQDFANVLKTDSEKWSKLIKELGIVLN